MKKYFLLPLTILFCAPLFGQTKLYENPDFDRIARRHKIIAIMPFDATITLRPKDMKDITPEQLDRMEKAEGESIQSALHSWFLKRDKQGSLTVEVQPPAITNAKLNQAEIDEDNYEEYTPGELAEILGVDAIIMGSFETNKPMSEGASVALGVVFGFYGATNKAVLNLYIYNAEDSDILVNYHKGVKGSIGSSTEDLINRLMRKASRRIAYTK